MSSTPGPSDIGNVSPPEYTQLIHINHLPRELIIQILHHAIPEPSTLLVYRAIIRIMLTCRFWCQITLGAPIMWTRIAVADFGAPSPRKLMLFLERSQSSLLHVYVQFSDPREIPPLNRSTSGQWEVDVKALLRPHLARVRILRFKGDTRRFFPLEVPSPELRYIYITKAHEMLPPPELSSTPALFTSWGGEMVKTLDTESNDLNPFPFLDPSHIENLSLSQHATWDHVAAGLFLQSARQLKILKLPSNAFRNSPGVRLDFPLLEEIRLGEPWGALVTHFGPMPRLAHLTLISYHPEYYTLLEAEATAWPSTTFPSLKTFTLDHCNIPDLRPLFATSRRIRGIHLHGVEGFLDFLQLLCGKNEAAERRDILPSLRYLRLWPTVDSGPPAVAAGEDFQPCMQALAKLMCARPRLRVEIGTRVYELWVNRQNGPDQLAVEWTGQWDQVAILNAVGFDWPQIVKRLSIKSASAKSTGYGIGKPPLPEMRI
ncbi:hypothetical protein DL93DRAFT_2085259 [Clavulina sp. PMI_390]|nr:hypothetical protein DL93DRAFT_2085259 [Clavulina sp. PMI_390]